MTIPSVEVEIGGAKRRAKARHRVGLLALGALIGGVPGPAAADAPAQRSCGPACQQRQRLAVKLDRAAPPASPTVRATRTATSPLALLGPAARAVPVTTFTVTTAVDVVDPGDGQLSLREAVQNANATPVLDGIRFAPSLEGRTLVLTGGQLTVSQDLILDGDLDDDGVEVTLSADYVSGIMGTSGSGTDLALSDLTIQEGEAPSGGGLSIGGGSLSLDGCTVRNSSAQSRGGGIYLGNGSSLTAVRSTFSSNDITSDGAGAAIATGNDVSLTITDSELSGNFLYGAGGAIALGAGGSLVMTHSIASGNRVVGVGGAILAGSGSSVIVRDSELSGNAVKHGAAAIDTYGDLLVIERSIVRDNGNGYGYGGVIVANSKENIISQSTISGNRGGGIQATGNLFILDSTIASNTASFFGAGVGALGPSNVIQNSTITGNSATFGATSGGIYFSPNLPGTLDIANSIIAGNSAPGSTPDISGTITLSNGHNVFGSDVAGDIPGDRIGVAPATVFAAIDPATGGGKLDSRGIVPLRSNLASNPALSGADPLAASAFGQLGSTPRPLPAGSLPDIGSVETDQALSSSPTGNNDVLTGTNADNTLTGFPGADYLKGLGGKDTLEGGPGGDLLDGGPGNDKLQGGTGLDLAAYPGGAAVVIDLSGTSDTAKRGSETDTLIGIEGALGSSGNDTFKGDELNNEFQGKTGKDTMTGGLGRDSWDFNDVADSPAGATRDLVTDFAPGQDVIDLAGVDADSTVPGNQSFRWVAKANLTGAAQLGYFVSGATTIVRASTDADAAAELEIQLTGVKTLTAGDFRP